MVRAISFFSSSTKSQNDPLAVKWTDDSDLWPGDHTQSFENVIFRQMQSINNSRWR